MNDIEKKLAKYRAQKEREEKYKKFKETLKNNLTSYFPIHKHNSIVKEDSHEHLLNSETDRDNCFPTITDDNLSEVDSLNTEDDTSLNCWSCTDWIYFVLCFTLWATIYYIFIKLQFGTIFLIVSALIGIYFNTRTGPKRKNEISAYSVFNKDCISIDGTLKAEQFEREIRYGPSAVQ